MRLIEALDQRSVDIDAVLLAEGPWAGELGSLLPVSMVEMGAAASVARSEAARARSVQRNVRSTMAAARALAAHCRQQGTELLAANSLKAAAVCALAAPLARVPWVWHLHDRLAKDYLPGALVHVSRAAATALPRAIVANSMATARTLGRATRRKVAIAYPGVPDGWFDDPGPDTDGPVVMLGRVSETKGQLEFADAVMQAAPRLPGVPFVVAGDALFQDGGYRDALARHPAVRTGAVTLAGWVDDPSRILRSSRLLVHASPVPEPFGQVIVEAMAAGVPVVATAAGGAGEVLGGSRDALSIGDGVWRARHGLAARPGDARALGSAIEHAIRHPEEMAALAAAARTHAWETYRIVDTARVTLEVWHHASGRGQGLPPLHALH